MQKPLLFLVYLGALLLSACDGGTDSGRVDLVLTDTPADQASSVVVEFTGVRFQPAVGNPIDFTFPTAQQIDLAQLQQGITTPLLTNLSLPSGHYQWLELEVSATQGAADSYVVLNSGGKHGLVLTTTGQTGLRTGAFDVKAAAGSTMIIDFDARKSVLPPVGSSTDYQLQPHLRMLDIRAGGNIVGSVQDSLAAAAGCTPVVYVYSGTVANPSDINASAPAATQPIMEAPVRFDNTLGVSAFTAAYLPAGTYTLAFTCDASKDDPSKADSLTFAPVGTINAIPGETLRTRL